MLRTRAVIVIGLLLLSLAGSLAAAESGQTIELGNGRAFTYRFLWPADPARPGENLVELTANPAAAPYKTQTPLGMAETATYELATPAGEAVAGTYVVRLGPDAWVFNTQIRKPITAPTGKFERPHFALPAISPPRDYRNTFDFAVEEFVTPMSYAVPTTGPVLVYNDNLDVLVISPLDHFMAALQAPDHGEWRCGFEGLAESVPARTTAVTLVVAGHGVNATFMKWGKIIQQWYGHRPVDPYADVAMSRLGYWTDNGSYYYYRTEPGLNYAQTLLAVKADADRNQIPYGYFQLDSWWYPKADIKLKSSHDRGGVLTWEPIPEMFPDGLAAFQKQLGLPLVAHNRYIADTSPYCDNYSCAPQKPGDKRRGAFPTNSAFWDEIMDNAKKFGVTVYEQDWLYTHMDMFPWLRSDLTHAESWYDAMADAAENHGITMQLCMASPEFFLQQLKHGNATHARVSHDYKGGIFKNFFWVPFHKSSLFAAAVGLWPFKDNFQSTAGQKPTYNLIPEGNPWEEALIAALSGGPVGPSDRIGYSDRDLIMRTCRSDGLLLKPDRPATPIDAMFIHDKNIFTGGPRPWTVSTESAHAIGTTTYLAAFNLWPTSLVAPYVNLSELGLSGPHLAYNYRTGEAKVVTDRLRFGRMKYGIGYYYILAPILDNGMALIGETDKFITMSAKRFPAAEFKDGVLALTIEGVPGAPVKIEVYANHVPQIAFLDRAIGEPAKSDEGNGIYSFVVFMPASGRATLQLQ